MSFEKPFKTIEEQIERLQRRKLIITDENEAKLILLSNNYYNIINGYSKFFPMQGDDYTNHTSFEEINRLYIFDTELKHAYLRAILAAEQHLKSIYAHRFAEAYPDIKYPYLDINCYDHEKTLDVVQTIHKLSGIINRQKKFLDSSISHYVRAHDHVPVWVLVNYIGFGDLRFMVTNSPKKIQNKVARDMFDFAKQNLPDLQTFPPEFLIDMLTNINELRNVCAHNNRFIGFKCHHDSRYWADLHDQFGIHNYSERRDAYSVYISLQCFLSTWEFSFLHNTIRKRTKRLSNVLTSISVNHILHTLGFPDDWHINTEKLVP